MGKGSFRLPPEPKLKTIRDCKKWYDRNKEAISSLPHPLIYNRGLTAADYIDWLMANAGINGLQKGIMLVRRQLLRVPTRPDTVQITYRRRRCPKCDGVQVVMRLVKTKSGDRVRVDCAKCKCYIEWAPKHNMVRFKRAGGLYGP